MNMAEELLLFQNYNDSDITTQECAKFALKEEILHPGYALGRGYKSLWTFVDGSVLCYDDGKFYPTAS